MELRFVCVCVCFWFGFRVDVGGVNDVALFMTMTSARACVRHGLLKTCKNILKAALLLIYRTNITTHPLASCCFPLI